MESTKHSTATKVFRERRKISKLISWKKYVKFHTSLMRQGQNLLTFARNLCAEAEEPIGNRQVYSFRNKMELVEILAKLDLDSYQLVDHDFDEFQEGIPPTKLVSLLARIYTYQVNLLFVGTKAHKHEFISSFCVLLCRGILNNIV